MKQESRWERLPRALWKDATDRLENHGELTAWDADALFVEYLPVFTDETIDWLAAQAGSDLEGLECSSAKSWEERGLDAVFVQRLHEVAHDEHLAKAHQGLTLMLWGLGDLFREIADIEVH